MQEVNLSQSPGINNQPSLAEVKADIQRGEAARTAAQTAFEKLQNASVGSQEAKSAFADLKAAQEAAEGTKAKPTVDHFFKRGEKVAIQKGIVSAPVVHKGGGTGHLVAGKAAQTSAMAGDPLKAVTSRYDNKPLSPKEQAEYERLRTARNSHFNKDAQYAPGVDDSPAKRRMMMEGWSRDESNGWSNTKDHAAKTSRASEKPADPAKADKGNNVANFAKAAREKADNKIKEMRVKAGENPDKPIPTDRADREAEVKRLKDKIGAREATATRTLDDAQKARLQKGAAKTTETMSYGRDGNGSTGQAQGGATANQRSQGTGGSQPAEGGGAKPNWEQPKELRGSTAPASPAPAEPKTLVGDVKPTGSQTPADQSTSAAPAQHKPADAGVESHVEAKRTAVVQNGTPEQKATLARLSPADQKRYLVALLGAEEGVSGSPLRRAAEAQVKTFEAGTSQPATAEAKPKQGNNKGGSENRLRPSFAPQPGESAEEYGKRVGVKRGLGESDAAYMQRARRAAAAGSAVEHVWKKGQRQQMVASYAGDLAEQSDNAGNPGRAEEHRSVEKRFQKKADESFSRAGRANAAQERWGTPPTASANSQALPNSPAKVIVSDTHVGELPASGRQTAQAGQAQQPAPNVLSKDREFHSRPTELKLQAVRPDSSAPQAGQPAAPQSVQTPRRAVPPPPPAAAMAPRPVAPAAGGNGPVQQVMADMRPAPRLSPPPPPLAALGQAPAAPATPPARPIVVEQTSVGTVAPYRPAAPAASAQATRVATPPGARPGIRGAGVGAGARTMIAGTVVALGIGMASSALAAKKDGGDGKKAAIDYAKQELTLGKGARMLGSLIPGVREAVHYGDHIAPEVGREKSAGQNAVGTARGIRNAVVAATKGFFLAVPNSMAAGWENIKAVRALLK